MGDVPYNRFNYYWPSQGGTAVAFFICFMLGAVQFLNVLILTPVRPII